MLILERPWTRQPQTYTGASAAWVSRGLRALYCLTPGLWSVNQVTGRVGGTPQGTGVTFNGNRLRTPGVSSNGAILKTNLPSSAFYTAPASIAIGCTYISGTGEAWSMLCDISTWNGYWSSGTGSVGFSRANDFSGNLATGNHSVAFTHIATNNLRGAGGNGIFVTDTAVSYLTDPSRDEITLGWNRRQGVNERPAVGEFTYFAAFNRALSDAELISVATNPWQLFKPLRIYIPTAAAAASSLPTLSLPTYVTGSVTATGARGRVTATAP